ncbi:aldolase/citrate lyase family protein [Rhodococcus sp. T2V]|uniref:HpcH/HpaI aldolase/citrate lyase family protein n=1 Tax=Rhodococcus sp. T2V TaxID=3034164 RepID=UPI0023E20651|nr:aldolase/citrate lyase family protein [Rhodococcus sp. T2V]MDF3312033.1 aldolase/citrate lyase family protein [Rhodococcus sp. T2V]
MPTHDPSCIALARTWLLAAAADPAVIAAADSCRADVLVLDLEDGVADRDKAAARRHTARWRGDGHTDWVRINDATTSHWSEDLRMLADTGRLGGVMLAKTEHAEQVEATADRLPAGTAIVALIESALGLEEARPIARAAATVRLAFGSGDFRRDTGAGADPVSLAYARSRLVVASRAERIAPPIDGTTHADTDTDLLAGVAVGVAAGMTGKLCLRPDHIASINTALSRPHDIDWAEAVIARLGVDGAHVTNGSDRPKLARALRIRQLVTAFATDGA